MSIESDLRYEFYVFRAAFERPTPFPHPTERNGLPAGWQVYWYAEYPPSAPASGVPLTGLETHAEVTGFDVLIVHRLAGGWALVFHEADETGWLHTTLSEPVASSLTALHTLAIEEAKQGPGSAGALKAVRAFITSCYNMGDPVEAAEATLVGLGAPITVFPRLLVGQ